MLLLHDLINIQEINPNIRTSIVYATPHNFTGAIIYDRPACYLRKEVAHMLDRVQKKLEPMGLGLLVWDGYRPLSAQKKFWELVPDERYVADPKKGGRHNRGAAVDVTLVTTDGKELEMPTKFDDFTEKAHRSYKDLPDHVIKNRDLLEKVMHEEGFIGWANEWWHFDAQNWQQYDVLDISFEQLES